MTRHSVALACAAIACSSPPPAQPREYAVRDTAEWECGGNGGFSGVLHRGDSLIDTVDLTVGVHPVPGGVIFAPLKADTGLEVRGGCPTEALLFENGTTRLLREFLPLYTSGAPAVTSDEDAIHYWGIAGDRLYAMRYVWSDQRVDSLLLSNNPMLLATDNLFHFEPPQIVAEGYVFAVATGMRFTLDSAWRIVSTDSIAR